MINKPYQFVAITIAFALLLSGGVVNADVRLPAIISDHAVLQKSNKVPIWGWADPGENISVTMGNIVGKSTANAAGKWRIDLDLSESEVGPFDLVVSGKNEVRVVDLLVGEVWLCAGQSNMEMRLSSTWNAKEVIDQTNNPSLRHFRVERQALATPADDVVGKWVKATSLDARSFSATGFYFGQALQHALKRPVGLINCSWGGSLVESWMSKDAFQTNEATMNRFAQLDDQLGKTKPAPEPKRIPSALFNGMLSPLIPYAIAGAVWYQGESNVGVGQAMVYPVLLNAMIRDWRNRWDRELPFYLCQLANFQAKTSEPGLTSLWAEFREGQTKFIETPQTGQAILIDIGEEGSVHPGYKSQVGERLALIALAKNYGRDVVFSGPVIQSFTVEHNKIRLNFSHAHGGLLARSVAATYQPKSTNPETVPLLRNSPQSELEGFIICGEDRKWVWAEAKIEGNSVFVWSPQIPKPVAVRYAWANNPTCNLYNGAGLPAGPFRTDNFPLSAKSEAKK
jgi:sialate O-acetylesterase